MALSVTVLLALLQLGKNCNRCLKPANCSVCMQLTASVQFLTTGKHTRCGLVGRELAVFSGTGRAPEPMILVIHRCLKSKWRITPTGKAVLLSLGASAWAY